jgi:hypothetical protein
MGLPKRFTLLSSIGLGSLAAFAAVIVACGTNAPGSAGSDAGADASVADAGGTVDASRDAAAPDSTSSDTGPSDSTLPDTTRPMETGTGGDAGVDASPISIDAGGCTPTTTGLWPFEVPASGVVMGPEIAAEICNAGAYVFTNNNGTFLEIDEYDPNLGDPTGPTTVRFTNPTPAEGPQDPLLDVLIPVEASPGTYTSSDAVNCGGADFSYSLPPPAGLDCDGGAPPQCPPGCVSACSGQGCLPCTPNPPFFDYAASGQTGGICAEADPQPGTLTGSWKIVLTSVDPFVGDAGGGSPGIPYVVHGTFVASLLGGGGDAGNVPATLEFRF